MLVKAVIPTLALAASVNAHAYVLSVWKNGEDMFDAPSTNYGSTASFSASLKPCLLVHSPTAVDPLITIQSARPRGTRPCRTSRLLTWHATSMERPPLRAGCRPAPATHCASPFLFNRLILLDRIHLTPALPTASQKGPSLAPAASMPSPSRISAPSPPGLLRKRVFLFTTKLERSSDASCAWQLRLQWRG